MAKIGERMRSWLKKKCEGYENAHQMAIGEELSYGLVYMCLGTGRDSKTLRDQIKEKHGVVFIRKRTRLIAECDQELIDDIDELRGDLSRGEWLKDFAVDHYKKCVLLHTELKEE